MCSHVSANELVCPKARWIVVVVFQVSSMLHVVAGWSDRIGHTCLVKFAFECWQCVLADVQKTVLWSRRLDACGGVLRHSGAFLVPDSGESIQTSALGRSLLGKFEDRFGES